MAWIKYSNYCKRIWDIKFEGTTIHLIFVERISRYPQNQLLEVSWTTSKFRGVKFSFSQRFDIRQNQDWKAIFKHLRRSLAHGLNQNARAVTDRLLSVDTNRPHPIHQMTRTSKAV